MQGIPIEITSSPSLPNQIFQNQLPYALYNNNTPIKKPKVLASRLLTKQSNLSNSTRIFQNSARTQQDLNRSMPLLKSLCNYPESSKFSQTREMKKHNDFLLSRNIRVKSRAKTTPITPSTSCNLQRKPLKQNVNIDNSSAVEEKFCKICFESTENKASGKLINPCKCTGSVRFIHEECLKTWQVAQNKDIKSAECELCHFRYSMNFQMGFKFYPRQAIDDGLLSFISSLCLFVLISTLIAIIVIFALQLNDPNGIFAKTNSGNDAGGAYKLGILISCCVICLILTILLIFSLKEACFIPQVTKWSIFNFEDKAKKRNLQKKVKKSTILPKSNSENLDEIKPGLLLSKHDIRTRIVRVNIIKIKEEQTKTKPINENNNPYILQKKNPESQQSFVIRQNQDYQQNLIKFHSMNSSQNSPHDQQRNLCKDYQKNLIQFSSNQSSKKNIQRNREENRKNSLEIKKVELLKFSSINSSSSISSFCSKLALKEQFAQAMPTEFVNLCGDKEKILDVVMHQPKAKATRNDIIRDLLPLKDKKMKYAGAKKSFYLFKKQTVFTEDKPEDKIKNSLSPGHLEGLSKK